MDVTIQVIRKKNDDKKIRTEEKDEKDNAVEMSPMTSMGNSAAYAFLRERFKKKYDKNKGRADSGDIDHIIIVFVFVFGN